MPPRCHLLSGALPLRPRALPVSQPTIRTFTTSPTLHRAPKGGDLGSHLPQHVIPKGVSIPPYPYGEALLFKQSNKGLYGGQTIQFGNNVSPDTETKSRRSWKPNVLNKALYSVALGKRIKLRITSKVLKIMDREGGLDEYLLKESETRIKELGPLGWALRWRLMQTPSVIARFRAEAAALGITQDVIDKQWPVRPQYIQQVRDAAVARSKLRDMKTQAAAAVQEDKDAVRERKTWTYYQIRHYAKQFVKNGKAKNMNAAEKMALPLVLEDEKLLRFIFRNSNATLLAYRKALSRGQVDKDSIPDWYARYRAKMKVRYEKVEEEMKESEAEQHEVHMVKRAEEEKDWAELAPAAQTQPRAAA